MKTGTIASKINHYQVKRVIDDFYIESIISGKRRFIGKGELAEERAKKTVKEWNSASDKYIKERERYL